ncbi:unnamed protein product [Citrullus colocynthis]|uniref:FAF domain-containing protein n=1 Tax=Citrullus colocynthis TaxID=252529 RepID=A0ABP0Z4U3_9ROSI
MDYFSAERNLFTKLKMLVSSFFGFLLCASSFRFPMQNHTQSSVLEEEEEEEKEEAVPFSISGLKALISSEEDQENGQQLIENRVIRSIGVGIIRSNLLTHSSSSFCSIRSCNLLMDDLIGTESGVCLTSNSEEIQEKLTHFDFDCRHYRTNRHDFTVQNRRRVAKKQFPPPIRFLAVQAAGHRPRSPWILTRYCSNRRLILKLERVMQHQCLESRRENGRLILNLVPIDDQDLRYFIEEDEGNEEIDESIECGGEDEGTDSEIAFKSFTYGGEGGGGIMFCGVNGNFEERHVVHGHFGSAPLRPMGTVM